MVEKRVNKFGQGPPPLFGQCQKEIDFFVGGVPLLLKGLFLNSLARFFQNHCLQQSQQISTLAKDSLEISRISRLISGHRQKWEGKPSLSWQVGHFTQSFLFESGNIFSDQRKNIWRQHFAWWKYWRLASWQHLDLFCNAEKDDTGLILLIIINHLDFNLHLMWERKSRLVASTWGWIKPVDCHSESYQPDYINT